MNELDKLIDDTLSEQAKDQIGTPQPDHVNQLFDDIRSINIMTEAMIYVLKHHPYVFELAYKEALKNNSR